MTCSWPIPVTFYPWPRKTSSISSSTSRVSFRHRFAAPSRHLDHDPDARHLLEEIVFLVLPDQPSGNAFERPMRHEHRVADFYLRLFAAEVKRLGKFGIAHDAEVEHLFGRNLIVFGRSLGLSEHHHLSATIAHQFIEFSHGHGFLDEKQVTHHGAKSVANFLVPVQIIHHPHGNECLHLVILEEVGHLVGTSSEQTDGEPRCAVLRLPVDRIYQIP